MKLSDIIKSGKSRTSVVRRTLLYKAPELYPYQILKLIQDIYDDCDITVGYSSTVDRNNIILNGYYCHVDDKIEIAIYVNNENDLIKFTFAMTRDIEDTFVHEMVHRSQHSKRSETPIHDGSYRSNPDEIDAYGVSIALQLSKIFSFRDALDYIKTFCPSSSLQVSTDLYGYRKESKSTLIRLGKKVFKYLHLINIR